MVAMTRPPASSWPSALAVGFGVLAYVVFLCTFVYAVAFLEDFALPIGPESTLGTVDAGGSVAPPAQAILIDLLLLSLFAVQHSFMARRSFKRWWTRFVPSSLERSVYVLVASGCLLLVMLLWHPVPTAVWTVGQPWLRGALVVLSLLGWLLVLASTFLISHTELFGLRQVMSVARGEAMPRARFATPLFYRSVRHPLYLGFLIAFWATPTMTVGRAIFAAAGTGYILVGIWFEERDLVHAFGERYVAYRSRVPMLIPLAGRARRRSS